MGQNGAAVEYGADLMKTQKMNAIDEWNAVGVRSGHVKALRDRMTGQRGATTLLHSTSHLAKQAVGDEDLIALVV